MSGDKSLSEPAHCDDLTQVLESAWRLLSESAADVHAPTHIVNLVTVPTPGEWAGRHVVLRDCDRDTNRLVFHTDRRSAKFRHLIDGKQRCEVHLYAASQHIQLRLSCACALYTDGPLFNECWQSTSPASKLLYQVTDSPGSELEDPRKLTCDPQTTNCGMAHFAVIEAKVDRLEWLYLGQQHRRADFRWRDGTLVSERWLVP